MAEVFYNFLNEAGIGENSIVAIYSSKNVSSIAMMIACSMRACLYVPLSSANPSQRVNYILRETNARLVLCDDATSNELRNTDLNLQLLFNRDGIHLFSVPGSTTNTASYDDAAFILFTSGSTGTPKGVVISHAAAITFADWAANEFGITRHDRIASIAPFNFDLSIFDIYSTAKQNGTLLLYTEDETKNVLVMAERLSTDKATTIYATPTFYTALANYGKLTKYDYSELKNVLFAGEIFHIEAFSLLLRYWHAKKFANLYGPTETNVCTYFKVDTVSMDYPVFPIGKSCSYASLLLVDENDNEIKEKNRQGELLIAGRTLFNGYWNDEQKTGNALLTGGDNTKYYRSGDLVYRNDNDDYVYVSRKDRMIKRYGFRIEPSEIEMILLKLPDVSNAAVFFSEKENLLVCFLENRVSTGESTVALKQYCLKYLPNYMVPDKFIILNQLPKTVSGKLDLQALKNFPL